MSDPPPSSASATPQTVEKDIDIAPPVSPKQPSPKALYRLARGALITAVVSLAFHPFSIWIGYQISQALHAPRASLEYVVPTIYREPLVFDATLLRGCLGSPRSRDKIRLWDTRVMSVTRNGGSSVACFRPPSLEVGLVRPIFGWWSMPSSTFCVAAVLGACCRTTFPRTRRSICTSSSGETMGPGRRSMTSFAIASEIRRGARRAPVQRLSIARA